MALPLSADLSAALREDRPRPQGPFTARLEVAFDLPAAAGAGGFGSSAALSAVALTSAAGSGSAAPASGGGARAQQPRVMMPPEVEAELGNCSTSGGGSFLPKWTEGSSCLIEYAFAVEEALEARVRDITHRRAMQPEPSGAYSATGIGSAWRDVVAGTPAAVGGAALSQTVGTAAGALGALASGATTDAAAEEEADSFLAGTDF